MKTILLSFVVGLACLGWENGKVKQGNTTQPAVKDSSFYLKASKGKQGEICLQYRLKNTSVDRSFCFKYFDYSEVVFPDIAVGVIKGNSVSESTYYLVRDSILVMPLIGMNNLLSVYVLDLRSQEVIGDDIRTSLDLVWVDEKNATFLTADTPAFVDDTTYVYTLNRYKIEGKKLSLIKRDTVHLKEELDDQKIEYGIARRMLR